MTDAPKTTEDPALAARRRLHHFGRPFPDYEATTKAAEALRVATLALMQGRERRNAIAERMHAEEHAEVRAVRAAEQALQEACRKASRAP